MFNLCSCVSSELKACWRSMTFSIVVRWASAIASTRPIGHSDPQRICASNTDTSSFDNRDVFFDIVLMVRSRKHQRQLLIGKDKTNQLFWFRLKRHLGSSTWREEEPDGAQWDWHDQNHCLNSSGWSELSNQIFALWIGPCRSHVVVLRLKWCTPV